MKFWQLVSIFRDEVGILENELKKKEWSFYFDAYINLESIVKEQKRNILDMQVENLLLENICAKSTKKIYCTIDQKEIYSYENNDTEKIFSILEAIDLFDHSSLEEVFEKSASSRIN